MILKRVEKENVVKAIYDSSNILASKYDKTSKDLTITFKRGAQYKYIGVSASDYMRFETAESQGAVLNSHIKPYSFEKGEAIDANVIVEEINKLKNEEVIKHQESIIADMERIVSDFDQNQTFNESTLMDLVKRITNYFNPVVNE
jgi:hypothetical protein